MRLPIWGMIGAALACTAGSAGAMQCYTVLDRSDNVIYRNADRGIQLFPDALQTTAVHNTVDGNGSQTRSLCFGPCHRSLGVS